MPQEWPLGKTIAKVRWMMKTELKEQGWEPRDKVPVLILNDGSMIFPSCDEEGNAPGCLFGEEAGVPVRVLP